MLVRWIVAPAGCGAPPPAPPPHRAAATASAPAPAPASASAPAPAPAPPPKSARAEAAERILYLATHLRTTELREACPETLAEAPRVRCLLSLRYADNAASKKLALDLYEETGSLAGLLPEEETEGGRGQRVSG
ncbi:hypothetical protein [Polyangium jinanense]|uniref:Uncharacterized protein n=1 Tax=Polyangium jinanense TaxID=2829994 RepID=A0A9X3XH20_9BACT|nr:hypothetical protein [Polyangium jinanense]MDC3961591.1 hypothetical protein [Polyangium jinanense]MDC3987956.1 hypothetical protein [Polyangium jinanense]